LRSERRALEATFTLGRSAIRRKHIKISFNATVDENGAKVGSTEQKTSKKAAGAWSRDAW